MTDGKNNTRIAESLEEQLDHAAEELITGDSDDSTQRRAGGGDAHRLTWSEG